MAVILPSDATLAPSPWGPDHDRLHRHLLRHPSLLPKGARLLLAVSGGQDSMALTALLRDLRSRHGWELLLWHGDHGWRAEAAAQGEALAVWAAAQGLPLRRERAEAAPSSEAAARQWRYDCLGRQAAALGCRFVLTGHTASDRAETLLLHLARGSHRRGLASLRPSRPLAEGSWLVRPLLRFSRLDTARICRELGLPVWIDTSNTDPRFSRNRVRAEVLPVLEELHPGASWRIAATAERLAQDEEQDNELLAIALDALTAPVDSRHGEVSLARRPLVTLQRANQRRLLQAWLRRHWGRLLRAADLEELISRIPLERGSGRQDLAQGWHLRWDRCHLTLVPPPPCRRDHGELHKQR
ncbi:MAG: tRNA lysidine(34) synthetase TilS [Cyanobacteriota bacterium]|nr:tRNA lysidine(34) synthetase TilS [Cyanobacteriota bacterium]